MRIFDISQEILSCCIYPGDPAPAVQKLQSMKEGALYNLSAFSMCAHNGTHVDAPAHFFADGKTVDQLPPEAFAGECFVGHADGALTAEDAKRLLADAASVQAARRILIAGNAIVTEKAAEVFRRAQILLLGVESQSVGPEEAPMAVHKLLLGAEVVLLEGLVLTDIPCGRYLLSAAPLNLAGCEGSPCRAILFAHEN